MLEGSLQWHGMISIRSGQSSSESSAGKAVFRYVMDGVGKWRGWDGMDGMKGSDIGWMK
jgi:hypothetical protein